MVSKDQRKKPLGKPYLSCIITLISNKLFNLDLECTQYIHKIYVVTAQAAKQLLEKHNYTYEEINISKDENAKAFLKGNGYKTVPQIFYNGTEYIGDYTMFKERLNKQ